MVANIGPASYNYEETVNTLRYANRAKNIKNTPKINEDPKDALLREYQSEIERLKDQLKSRSQGITQSPRMKRSSHGSRRTIENGGLGLPSLFALLVELLAGMNASLSKQCVY